LPPAGEEGTSFIASGNERSKPQIHIDKTDGAKRGQAFITIGWITIGWSDYLVYNQRQALVHLATYDKTSGSPAV